MQSAGQLTVACIAGPSASAGRRRAYCANRGPNTWHLYIGRLITTILLQAVDQLMSTHDPMSELTCQQDHEIIRYFNLIAIWVCRRWTS